MESIYTLNQLHLSTSTNYNNQILKFDSHDMSTLMIMIAILQTMHSNHWKENQFINIIVASSRNINKIFRSDLASATCVQLIIIAVAQTCRSSFPYETNEKSHGNQRQITIFAKLWPNKTCHSVTLDKSHNFHNRQIGDVCRVVKISTKTFIFLSYTEVVQYFVVKKIYY